MKLVSLMKKQLSFFVRALALFSLIFGVIPNGYGGFSPQSDSGSFVWQEISGMHLKTGRASAVVYLNGGAYAGTWSGVYRLGVIVKSDQEDHDVNKSSYSWTRLSAEKEVDTPTKVLAMATYRKQLYVATKDNGVYRMNYEYNEEGVEWENIGLREEEVQVLYSNLSSSESGFLYAGTKDGNLYRYNEFEKLWEPIAKLGDTKIYSLYENGGCLYAGTDHGEIFQIGLPAYKDGPIKSYKKIGLSTLAEKPVLALTMVGGYFYAGTYGDGLFVGRVQGSKFVWKDAGLKSRYIFALLPGKDRCFYVGTGEGVFKGDLGTSYNGDVDWQDYSDIPHERVLSLAIDNTEKGVLYAGADSGLIYSSTDGIAWEKRVFTYGILSAYVEQDVNIRKKDKYRKILTNSESIESAKTNSICVHSDGYLYLGTNYAFLRSKDGRNWGVVNNLSEPIADIYSSGMDLYVATSYGGVYKNNSQADEWVEVLSDNDSTIENAPLYNRAKIQECNRDLYAAVENGWLFKLKDDEAPKKIRTLNEFSVLYSHDKDLYLGISGYRRNGVYKSENGNWRMKFWERGSVVGMVGAVYSDGDKLYIGTTKGVYVVPDDYGYHVPESYGLTGERITFLYYHDGYLYAGTRDSGVFRRGSNDAEWQSLGLGNESVITFTVFGDKFYAGTESGRILESKGKLEVWKSGGLQGRGVESFCRCNNEMYARTSDGYVVRDTGGGRWRYERDGLGEERIHTMCLKEGKLYAITPNGQIYKIKKKGGKVDWRQHANSLNSTNITGFVLYQDKFYVGTLEGNVYILQPEAGDLVWKLKNRGLEGSKIYTLYSNPLDDSLYAATSDGVYKYVANKDAWESYGIGLGEADISTLYSCKESVDGDDVTFLYAGSDNRGVYKLLPNEGQWRQVLSTKMTAAIFSDPEEHALFVGTDSRDGRVFLSMDNAKNWEVVTRFGKTYNFYKYDGILYVGTDKGIFYKKIE